MKKVILLVVFVLIGSLLTACELEDLQNTDGRLPEMAEYVERESDPDMLATIPPGGLVYERDFTVDEPIEEFVPDVTDSWNSFQVDGVGEITSSGLSEEERGAVVRQDEEGLHFHVTNIGDWSSNGVFYLFQYIPGGLEVTSGAFYSIYVEAKWEGAGDDGRLVRIKYAGRDASNQSAALYGTEFEEKLHTEVFLPGPVGEPAVLPNTETLELRVGYTGGTSDSWWSDDLGQPQEKKSTVDQTLVLRSVKVYRGATNSMHTTTPENAVRAYGIGGYNDIYNDGMMEMFAPEPGEGSQMPAIVYTGLQLVNGHEYELSFTHEAGRRRSIEVFIGHYDEYGRLLPLKDSPEKLTLETYSSLVTESWTFTWEGASIHDALLVISYGHVGPYVTGTTVMVSDVSVAG
jgi:hypothetical protein